MSFKTKLIVAYSVLIIALSVTFSIVFLQFTNSFYTEDAKSNIQALSERMSMQLDELVRPMEFLSLHFLSDFDNWHAIYTLTTIDKKTALGLNYSNRARADLQRKMYAYSIDKNFSRFSFFTKSGDFITSAYKIESKDPLASIQDLEWYLRHADSLNGKPILLPVHQDSWAKTGPQNVFSLLRSVRGMNNASYLEVQRSSVELENIFDTQEIDGASVIAMTEYGEILYTNIENPVDLAWLTNLIADTLLNEPVSLNHPETNEKVFTSACKSDYTGVTVFLMQDTVFLQNNIDIVKNLMFILSISIILVSVLYIYIMSNQLTKPLRNLRKKFETTSLVNLNPDMSHEKSNDEIEVLNKSYLDMLSRLQESIEKEKQMLLMSAQANFDSLQAQVNPHFIYNTLNIISNRGIENQDETICDICDCLADMLRYSTNTKKSQTKIFDELVYLKKYIYLLKQRYEDKLECNIEVSDEIYDQYIPKMLLQPLIENCINHGFSEDINQMRIKIKGYVDGNWWFVTIEDNGKGFDNEMLEFLKDSFSKYSKDIRNNYKNPEMEIGGLGLINIYCRILLTFQDDFIFNIGNLENGGAFVMIGVKKETEMKCRC